MCVCAFISGSDDETVVVVKVTMAVSLSLYRLEILGTFLLVTMPNAWAFPLTGSLLRQTRIISSKYFFVQALYDEASIYLCDVFFK